MRKVLLVTSYYPPGLQVGYERVVKLEQHLPDFGFSTCVLTMQTYGRLPSDAARGVYRAFEPSQIVRPVVRRLCRPVATTTPPGMSSYTRPEGVLESTRFAGLYRQLLDWFAIPDFFMGWLPAAVLLGLRAIRLEHVDVLLSSSPCDTAHLVALILSTTAHKPWLADFRDGWLFEPLKPVLRKDCSRRRLEERLERRVVAKASHVTTVSQPLTDYFSLAYPARPGKYSTIANGYDPADWRGVVPKARGNRFRLVHTGSFSLSRQTQSLLPFLHALRMVMPQVRGELEVLLVGSLSAREQRELAAMELGDVVSVVGPVTRRESLGYQLSADLLLLFAGSDRSVATTKLYEYLYARRPILALSAPDTAAATIVQECRAGEIVPPDDPKAIAASLTSLLARWQQDRLVCASVGIERYERRELARQMAGVLQQAINAGA